MSSEITELVALASARHQESNVQVDLNMRKRSEVSVEDRRIHRGKRTATDDGQLPRKRMRGSKSGSSAESLIIVSSNSTTESNTPGPSGILEEGPSLQQKKRKASDDGEQPGKRMRGSDSGNNSSVESVIVVSSNSTNESSSSERRVLEINNSESSVLESDPVEFSQFTSEQDYSLYTDEEERIFKMSPSANTSRADFEDKYCQRDPIGKEGYGAVYAGYRIPDDFPVAIKHIPIHRVKWKRITCNGKQYNVILEVAAMLKAAGVPGSVRQSAVIPLLDWYILDGELLMVMERPINSMDLYSYIEARGPLHEDEAEIILKQLVKVAVDMHDKDVFHRDIKIHNVLIQPDSDGPKVHLTDFGCSSLNAMMSYTDFYGTPAFFPPEWFEHKRYWAVLTTVWQLGALYFCLLTGDEYFSTLAFINNCPRIPSGLSPKATTLLQRCLERDPRKRICLEELFQHFGLESSASYEQY